MYRGIANKLAVYAYNQTTGAAVTGDQANITAQISKDGGSSAAVADTNPTQLDATNHPGIYIFDLTAAECDAKMAVVTPDSSTANVVLEPVAIDFIQAPYPIVTVVSDGANSATGFETDLTIGTTDEYKGGYLSFFTGALANEVKKITGSVTASQFLTFTEGYTATPSAGDKAYLINA